MSEIDDYVRALDPSAVAAYRQRHGVRPEGGRQAGPATYVLENFLPHMASKAINTAAIPGNVLREGLPDAGLSEAGAEAAIPKAMALSSMGPAASAPMALARGNDPATLAALYLRHRPKHDDYPNYFDYEILNDKGTGVGGLSGHYFPSERSLHIGSINSNVESPFLNNKGKQTALDANSRSFSIGPSDIRSLLMALKSYHPNAEVITGFRESGARRAANSILTRNENLNLPDIANAQTRIPNFRQEQLDKYWATAPEGIERIK